MRTALFSCLLLIFGYAHAQNERAFQWMAQTLAQNARYSTPVPWEGSERLRALYALEIATTTDSAKKAEFLMNQALSSLKQGDYDVAFADYETAARLNPKSRGSIGWRYLFFLRDYARALTYLNDFDAQTPNYDDPIDDYSVNYLKGRALAGLDQYEQAIAAYDVAIRNRESRYGLAWVDYRYLVARAVSYLAVKQAANALQDLDKALTNNPKSAMAHYHRGRALQQMDRTTEARNAFRDALFFVRSQPFERDYYYEQPDAAYEPEIEAALSKLKP